MFFENCPTYKGLPLIPVQSKRGGKNVLEELANLNLDLFDVAEVLEKGYESHRKRREEVVERYLDKGDKTVEAVVQKSYCFEQDVWEVIHVGIFTKKKR